MLMYEHQRTCLRCNSPVVDDEAHCLFMCEHPTIVEARDLFLAAVVPPMAALSSLRYADFWTLSATGCVPLPVLVKCVAVCVRVGWYCHQSGGTDVVDLPDILLPAGQYLDMFDLESETNILVVRLMRNWLKSRWIHAWVIALIGALDLLGGTYGVDLTDILLGWCSGLCLIWTDRSSW